MSQSDAMFESQIPGLPLIGRGKVRDIYELDAERLRDSSSASRVDRFELVRDAGLGDAQPGDVMQTIRSMVVQHLAFPGALGKLVGNVNSSWPLR